MSDQIPNPARSTSDLEEVLDPYLAGTLSETSQRQVDQSLAAHPEWPRFIWLIRSWLTGSGFPEAPVQSEAFQRLRIAIDKRTSVLGREVKVREEFSGIFLRTPAVRGVTQRAGRFAGQTLQRWFQGAAIVVAIATFYFSMRSAQERQIDVTRRYATSAGQQASFMLPDGTHVTLAPRTTLQLSRFGSAFRTVALDGQAYFEVARSSGVPFVVRTGAVATQVLGTAFLVRHYTKTDPVHVAVAEGKVGVAIAGVRGQPTSLVTLTAGHIGDVVDSTIQVHSVTDISQETDWLRGLLVFRQVPVEQVLQKLSQWYGYQFRCSDSALARHNVTLALDAQSSAGALSSLEQLLNVRMTIVGDTVTLTPYPSRPKSGTARKQAYDVWIPTGEAGR